MTTEPEPLSAEDIEHGEQYAEPHDPGPPEGYQDVLGGQLGDGLALALRA